MNGHEPRRPSWDCGSCEKPWPCDPTREAMRLELTRTTVAIRMGMYLELAVADLPTMPAREAFERFLAWTR